MAQKDCPKSRPACLPGMRDSPGLACRHARQHSSVVSGLARTALVLEFLLFVVSNYCNRLVPHGIVRVLFHDLENLGGTGDRAVPATIALVSIDGDEIIPGGVAVPIVSHHVVLPVSLPGELGPLLVGCGEYEGLTGRMSVLPNKVIGIPL